VDVLEADAFQPGIWYAGCSSSGDKKESVLFRTMDDAQGWEVIARFEALQVQVIRSNPYQPGLLAVVARSSGQPNRSWVHVSDDCGESWRARVPDFAFDVEDVAWAVRDGAPVLLLATDKGLYEINLKSDDLPPVPVSVDETNPDRGFYAIAAAVNVDGTVSVALAAQGKGGVFLSKQAGRTATFKKIGLEDKDVRVLRVQSLDTRVFLWAGVWVESAGSEGEGGYRWELRGQEDSPEGWQRFNLKWKGGSCKCLAFSGSTVFAGSHHAGVLRLETSQSSAAWQSFALESGLPLRDPDNLLRPIQTVATTRSKDRDSDIDLLLAGGPVGVYLSVDGGKKYEYRSATEFLDKVSLPETWLFCSGEHRIEVVSEDEAR
jgi:hypothetical protein